MNPINYAGDSGVVVDRCPSCTGLWLEHSELEKVQILLEKWEDAAPAQLRSAAIKLSRARAEAASRNRSFPSQSLHRTKQHAASAFASWT